VKRKASILIIIFTIFFELVAQDSQFTQFYSVPLYLAPSFAGATKQHRVGGAYRNQWSGFPGGFISYLVAYDHFMSAFNSGFGFYYLRDYAGSGKLGSSKISLLYSYDFIVNKEDKAFHIRPGLSFEYFKYDLNFRKLVFSDQITPSGTTNVSTNELPPRDDFRGNYDASASLLVFNPKIWFGFTANHLFRPNESLYNDKTFVSIKYSFFGGYQISRKSLLLKPVDESVSLAYIFRKQGLAQQLDIGLYWFKVPIVFGAWYRGIPIYSDRGDAIAFLVGYKTPIFSVGYSYDFTISDLAITSRGAHEISFSYHFQTSRKKRYHSIPCPEF
jgi:type IX secretion system PorP/SprF family membrane protein